MATLKDVAAKAGVSIATVSRVFNSPDKVKPDTKSRVQQAVKELDYKISRVAKRLRSTNGRAHMLGLIIPDIQNPFFADIARGVEDVAYKNNYGLLFGLSNENRKRQKMALETLISESVDGVIVPPVKGSNPDIQELLNLKIPVVVVDRRLDDAVVDTITCDNVHGAYLATKHLLELGHTRIGFIGGIPELATSKERLNGYKKAHNEYGVRVETNLILEGDSTQKSGTDLTERLLSMQSPPTAIFAANNLMTLGVLIAIHQTKKSIPDEISLIGYDDVPWAQAMHPKLTVVRQPSYQQGVNAAEMILQRIKNPERAESLTLLNPKLIVRESTQKPYHLTSNN